MERISWRWIAIASCVVYSYDQADLPAWAKIVNEARPDKDFKSIDLCNGSTLTIDLFHTIFELLNASFKLIKHLLGLAIYERNAEGSIHICATESPNGNDHFSDV